MEPLICLFAFRPLCQGRFSGNAPWCCVHLIPYFPPLCKDCNLIDQNCCISSLCNQEILLSTVSSGPDLVSSPNSSKWNTGRLNQIFQQHPYKDQMVMIRKILVTSLSTKRIEFIEINLGHIELKISGNLTDDNFWQRAKNVFLHSLASQVE